jgi:hypothetical protein
MLAPEPICYMSFCFAYARYITKPKGGDMVPSKSFRIAIIFIIVACILNVGCSAYNGQPVQKSSISSQPQVFSGAVNTSNNSLVFINGSVYQQPISPNGGLLPSSWWDPVGSDSDQYVWDDFTIASNQSITDIQWYGGYDPTILFGAGAAVNFSVKIYPSIAAGTQPDVTNLPLVSYLTNNNAGETLYGMVGGINIYSYSFTLPAAFNAVAGTKYWLQVEAYENGTPDWGLALGTGGDGKHFKRTVSLLGDPIKYSVGSGDAAFTLSGPVPAMPPTDILLTNTTVDENQPVNTIVGTLTAIDPDPNATFTFSLTCATLGVDDTWFNINGTDLQTSASFDFETKSTYSICIRVTDQNNLSFDKNFTINVNDVNEPPTDIALSNTTVDENQPVNAVVGVLSATDPDAGATFTFSLTCTLAGADDGSFNIFGTDLRTSAVFNFATKSIYDICIQVTDQGGLTFDKDFVISVNNVNGAPTDIALSANSVNENQPINTVIGALSATDPDLNATFTFTLTCTVAGADDSVFNIFGTNLRTSAMFDYETKSAYNICIRVTDQGGLFFDKNFIIIVNNLNEAPTSISLSNSIVDENQPINTIVGTLTPNDPDASATFTFSLACAVPGADDGSFNILGANLRTSAVFNFVTKSVYGICVRVTDQGGLTFDKNFIVTVNNVNGAPTDTALSNNVVDENQPINKVVGTLTATDPDPNSTFTFSLACSGADNDSFNISGASLRTSAVFDYETKSAYNICIHVTDQGGLTFDKNFVVTVNNVNEAPTGIFLSNSAVDENQPINTVVGGLTATDPDAGATFTFSLTCAVPGADDISFNVNGSNLQTSAVFDFETKSVYNICIRVTDQGGLTFDKNFTIAVNNLPENVAPTDIALSSNSVDENQPINTLVGALAAIDPNPGDTFTFSLACVVQGADDISFNILGANLRTSSIFNFEGQSTYNICVRVTDQGGLSFDRNFLVTVNDLNEVTNTPGKVTGGGNIDLTNGKATFGFTINYNAGDVAPKGNLTYQDHKNNLRLKAISFDLLVIEGNHAWFTGMGMLDNGQVVSFRVEVDALNKSGKSDTFYIHIPALNGYEASGVMSGGNIIIH